MAEGPNLAESIRGIIGFSFLMRILVPGVVGDLVLEPYTGWLSKVTSTGGEFTWGEAALPLLAAIGAGIILSILGDRIYEIYEGRLLWPRWLKNLGKKLQSNRLQALQQSYLEAETAKREDEVREINLKLLRYPQDKLARPTVTHPTMLGNILAEYERYPKSRYGIDSIFYWPRLWLTLEKDEKERIDANWSVADGLLYASAAAFFGAVCWLVYAAKIGATYLLSRSGSELAISRLLLGAVWLLAGYLIYRLSLPYHRSNGQVFKSLFDLYRDRIESMTRLGLTRSQSWGDASGYLQYLNLRCCRCDQLVKTGEDKCPNCGLAIATIIAFRT
jgi:hypothetical protein